MKRDTAVCEDLFDLKGAVLAHCAGHYLGSKGNVHLRPGPDMFHGIIIVHRCLVLLDIRIGPALMLLFP